MAWQPFEALIGCSYINAPRTPHEWVKSPRFNELLNDRNIYLPEVEKVEDLVAMFLFTRDVVYSIKGYTNRTYGRPKIICGTEYNINGPHCEDAFVFLQNFLLPNVFVDIDPTRHYIVIPLPGSDCVLGSDFPVDSKGMRIAQAMVNYLESNKCEAEILTSLRWTAPQPKYAEGAQRSDDDRYNALRFTGFNSQYMWDSKIILVDDVVAKGCTLKAANKRLYQHRINDVVSFAVATHCNLTHQIYSPLYPEARKFWFKI